MILSDLLIYISFIKMMELEFTFHQIYLAAVLYVRTQSTFVLYPFSISNFCILHCFLLPPAISHFILHPCPPSAAHVFAPSLIFRLGNRPFESPPYLLWKERHG